MKKEKFGVLILALILLLIFSKVYSKNINTNDIENNYDFKKVINIFEEYINDSEIEEFEPKMVLESIINSNGKVNNINVKNVIDVFFEQIKTISKECISLFVIIVIGALLSSIQLDEDSDVVRITKIVIYISLSILLVKKYVDNIVIFKDLVNKLTIIIQTVSTFLIGVVVATGKISSATSVDSIILCISNIICSAVEFIVIPCFSFSLVINIISKISENIKLTEFSKLFRKSTIYVFLVIIGAFFSVLKLETTITSSVDNLTYKVAQDAIANSVPIVGGFLSDSLDTVLHSTKIIGKVGGVFSIVCTGIIVLIPIAKLLGIIIVYSVLMAICEPLTSDNNIKELIGEFKAIHTEMLGIIIGIMVVLVISITIIINIIGNVGG